MDINLQGAKYLVSLIENNPFVANINLTGNNLQPQGVQVLTCALEANNSIIKVHGVNDPSRGLTTKLEKNYKLLHEKLDSLNKKEFSSEVNEELHRKLLILAKQLQATEGKLIPESLTNQEIGKRNDYLKKISELLSGSDLSDLDNPYLQVLNQTDLLGYSEDLGLE